jgi:hypothetical protein
MGEEKRGRNFSDEFKQDVLIIHFFLSSNGKRRRGRQISVA